MASLTGTPSTRSPFLQSAKFRWAVRTGVGYLVAASPFLLGMQFRQGNPYAVLFIVLNTPWGILWEAAGVPDSDNLAFAICGVAWVAVGFLIGAIMDFRRRR